MARCLILAAVAALLAGCETAPIGMVCYIPHGQMGGCQVMPPRESPTLLVPLPAAPAASATAV